MGKKQPEESFQCWGPRAGMASGEVEGKGKELQSGEETGGKRVTDS